MIKKSDLMIVSRTADIHVILYREYFLWIFPIWREVCYYDNGEKVLIFDTYKEAEDFIEIINLD